MLSGRTGSQSFGLALPACNRAGGSLDGRSPGFGPSWQSTRRNCWRLGMSISAIELKIPSAENVTVTGDTLSVDLSDGRTISVPLAWFPRLQHASAEERKHWRLIGRGQGIHWEEIDEDISVEGLLAGRPSGESQASFKKWLAARTSLPTKRSPHLSAAEARRLRKETTRIRKHWR